MRTNRHRRLIAYGILALGALVLVGWLRYEQQQSFVSPVLNEEPAYPAQHPNEEQIRQLVVGTLHASARLEMVARLFTQRFRQHDVPFSVWWAVLDSNQRPLRCERSALPLS